MVHFIYVLLFFMVLVGATLVVLSKWRSLLRQMIALVDCVRTAMIYYAEQRGAENIRRDVSTSPRAVKWGFPWRIGEADLAERLDLESGIEEQRQE